MKMGEKDKERIRACLIVNDVLSIADAQAKRFAMMNEVSPLPTRPRSPPTLAPDPLLCLGGRSRGSTAPLTFVFDALGRGRGGGADMCVGVARTCDCVVLCVWAGGADMRRGNGTRASTGFGTHDSAANPTLCATLWTNGLAGRRCQWIWSNVSGRTILGLLRQPPRVLAPPPACALVEVDHWWHQGSALFSCMLCLLFPASRREHRV